MTHEIQLAQAAGLAPARGDEMIAYAPQQGPQKPTGFKKIHRLLRGRYKYAVGFGILFALGGAIAGFLSQKPGYKSDAMIEVTTLLKTTNATAPDPVMNNASAFLRSQIAILQGREMISRAMQRDAWRKLNRPGGEDGVTTFYNNLDVEQYPGSNMIQVSFTDPDPKAAQAAVQSLWEAYKDWYDSQDPTGTAGKLKILQDHQDIARNTLDAQRQNLARLSKLYYGDDLTEYLSAKLTELGRLQTARDEAQRNYEMARQALADSQSGKKAGPLTAEEIAPQDPPMQLLLGKKRELTQKLMEAKVNYGDKHPLVIDTQAEIQIINKEIEDEVKDFNSKSHPIAGAPGSEGPNGMLMLGNVTQAQVDQLKKMADYLDGQTKAKEEECQKIAQTQSEINQAKQTAEQAKNDMDADERGIESFRDEQQLNSNNIQLASPPGMAVEPAVDKRKQMTAVGFIGGGILPVGLLLLIGLLDSRFRFSDETNTDLAGVPLLGILPNLPDLLTDPEQAATAAHCVHQIRTLLQINGHATDRRVFTVTSSAAGDGKTSLTLALGLSFAASGSRTLLIDADLVGAGLTARLGVSSGQGLLEAMASRDIMEFVRSTDVADLAILPVGEAIAGYGGAISPAAVRRLVGEARRHFDTIIIDTGPILGSIEASPVAVASDGVILCVARGQQRPVVDKALGHLQSIGARLAGVVFNRAEARDFERSVSRSTVQSLPALSNGGGRRREQGENGSRFGPVARAVASSVKPTGPIDRGS